MVELTERTPCAGLLPITLGGVTLDEMTPGWLTSLKALQAGDALSAALEKAHGMALPAPNQSTGKEGARCLWFGRGEALLMGPRPDAALGDVAAVVDQSDGWAVVCLSGPGVEDVLARLVPVDLRLKAFPEGRTIRSQVMHMHGSITRLGAERFMVMAYRSMAGTLVHDLKAAMAAVAARG